MLFRSLLKYTLNVDEENKVGGKLTVWFRSLRSLLGEPNRVCVCVLIFQAVLRLWKKAIPDKTALIMYLVIFAVTVFSGVLPLRVPAAVLVILAGVFGVVWNVVKEGRKQA